MFATQSQVVAGSTLAANEAVMLKQVQATLEKHFPNHFWLCGITQSILIIRNTILAGDAGYVVHLPAIYSSSWLDAEIMRAGGTILEAYNQRRGAMNMDHVVTLKTDFAGRHIIPAGSMKHDRKPVEQMVSSGQTPRSLILRP